ncbi:TIGR01457 family HAD-type hydrolase [Holzapfeliella sp. JNUCC 72]
MSQTYKGYLIDLDGTIYRGNETIEAGKEFVERLQEKNIPHIFLTNNSTRTPQMVVDKLAKHGVKTDVTHIYTPSMATAEYIHDQGIENPRVYIIGEVGLYRSLLDSGCIYDPISPDYVVVGMDQDLTYNKVKKATLLISNGAKFIGTNADTNLPSHEGLIPGAGTILKMVETATGQKPVVMGKPEKIIVDLAMKQLQLDKSDVAVVGDNYKTDIMSGINSHLDTILVYTGVSTPEQIAAVKDKPTHIVNSLSEWEV